ncbi:MAG: hypothetical protein KBA46_04505 [Candidatus Omnitrophica bacterium]|nr:hypothetical protein [Candidatus Omnitrophota bacterium]
MLRVIFKKIFLGLWLVSISFALGCAQESASAAAVPQETSANLVVLDQLKQGQKLPLLLFFFSESCHACHKTRHDVMPLITKFYEGKISIQYFDIADINNFKLMLALKERYNCKEEGVPSIFMAGKFLVGYEHIKTGLDTLIQDALRQERAAHALEKLPGVDLTRQFLSFGLAAILFAGLIDGINPCAFTVIVFFISFLAFQGYRKRELLIIGLSFIFAVFLTYVLVGLGIFRFLYALNQFYLFAKILYYAMAAFCFVLGIIALYDLWLLRKTGKTEGLVLQLPQAVKNKIHAVIGMHYRKTSLDAAAVVPQKKVLKLILSAFVTGFLISLLEAVCTGQLYLPTITFMLKESGLRMRAFVYLLLYNAMFVVPLAGVLVFALFGVTSEGFSRLIKKHMQLIKLLMAIMFFAFGFFIVRGA